MRSESSAVLGAVARHARTRPDQLALADGRRSLSYLDLERLVAQVAAVLDRDLTTEGPVAIVRCNEFNAVVLDLALIALGRATIHVPRFFSAPQVDHALADAGASWLIGDADPANPPASAALKTTLGPLTLTRLSHARRPVPGGTSKITYTSGSTGQPKGICLSQTSIEQVACSIVDRLGADTAGRHVPVLPLAVLLENVAGLYASLIAGGAYLALSADQLGLEEAFRPKFLAMAEALAAHQATSTITVPELLRGLIGVCATTGHRLPSLRFVAVGGAPVSPELLRRAAAVGIPAYQGYGLTEAGSVVALNAPGDNAAETVGRPLPHVHLSLGANSEIIIEDIAALGTTDGRPLPRPFATGDIGSFDSGGRLIVHGRLSNLIINSFGRNIAPEWVESELCARPEIAQAIVFGNDHPALGALIVPSSASVSDAALTGAVAAANASLPAYARVMHWAKTMPLTASSGLMTANGRPKRQAIHTAYRTLIAQCLATEGRTWRFFDRLVAATAAHRAAFLNVPQVRDGLTGAISLKTYLDYLAQAYHHVRHTVPLLTLARDNLPPRARWLRQVFDDYIAEETGHDEWILSDIRHAGGDAARVATSLPHPATRAMTDHAYHVVRDINPVAMFGMVFVLEGTSVAIAAQGADAVAKALGLPPECFSYLRSHGALDVDHLGSFQRVLDGIDAEQDRTAIIETAKTIFDLFSAMFAAIPHDLEIHHAA